MTFAYDFFDQDPADGLFYHGYNHDLGETNCCKWGRVNGWAMMAQAELLLSMHEVRPPCHSVTALFRHCLLLLGNVPEVHLNLV